MHVQTLREAIQRQPFVPFALRMDDGREFSIPYPDYLAVSDRSVYEVDSKTDAGIFLEPILIASLKPEDRPPQIPSPLSSGGNP
jgi:hypothetical protein